MPAVERSAGELFRTIPALSWIADDAVADEADHVRAIEAGLHWVADSDSGLLGFLLAAHAGQDLHIEELSVSIAAQGQGIGRALIAAAEEHARALGLTGLTLTTFEDIPWNAPYYARLGFEPLTGPGLDQRLAGIIRQEAARGLSGRCAMRKSL